MFLTVSDEDRVSLNINHIVEVDQVNQSVTCVDGVEHQAGEDDFHLAMFIQAGGGHIIPATPGWSYKNPYIETPRPVIAWFRSDNYQPQPLLVTDRSFFLRGGFLATVVGPDGFAMVQTEHGSFFESHVTTTVDKLEATYFEIANGRPPSEYAMDIFDRAYAGIQFNNFVSVYRKAKALEDPKERAAVAKVLKRQWYKFYLDPRLSLIDRMLDHEDEPFIWEVAVAGVDQLG